MIKNYIYLIAMLEVICKWWNDYGETKSNVLLTIGCRQTIYFKQECYNTTFGHQHMTRHILLWITIIDRFEYRVTLAIDKDPYIKSI